MLIVRSTLRCALACGGNEARETLRLVKRLAKWFGTHQHRSREPSESEPVSASLHKLEATNLPELGKSAAYEELTEECPHGATRGDWGGRATTVHSRSREIRPSLEMAGCHIHKVCVETITRHTLESEVGAVNISYEADVMSVEQRDRTVLRVCLENKGGPLE